MQASPANGQDPREPAIDQLVTALRAEIAHDPRVSLVGSSYDPNTLAKRVVASLPRTQNGNAMADKVGPFYETSGLIGWLGITKQALQRRRDTNAIVACKTQEGHHVYPVWQFQDDGSLIPGLREVLKVLAAGIKDGWTWALWLTSEVSGQLGGKSAVAWLTEGRDPKAVLDLARGDAVTWAA